MRSKREKYYKYNYGNSGLVYTDTPIPDSNPTVLEMETPSEKPFEPSTQSTVGVGPTQVETPNPQVIPTVPTELSKGPFIQEVVPTYTTPYEPNVERYMRDQNQALASAQQAIENLKSLNIDRMINDIKFKIEQRLLSARGATKRELLRQLYELPKLAFEMKVAQANAMSTLPNRYNEALGTLHPYVGTYLSNANQIYAQQLNYNQRMFDQLKPTAYQLGTHGTAFYDPLKGFTIIPGMASPDRILDVRTELAKQDIKRLEEELKLDDKAYENAVKEYLDQFKRDNIGNPVESPTFLPLPALAYLHSNKYGKLGIKVHTYEAVKEELDPQTGEVIKRRYAVLSYNDPSKGGQPVYLYFEKPQPTGYAVIPTPQTLKGKNSINKEPVHGGDNFVDTENLKRRVTFKNYR